MSSVDDIANKIASFKSKTDDFSSFANEWLASVKFIREDIQVFEQSLKEKMVFLDEYDKKSKEMRDQEKKITDLLIQKQDIEKREENLKVKEDQIKVRERMLDEKQTILTQKEKLLREKSKRVQDIMSSLEE